MEYTPIVRCQKCHGCAARGQRIGDACVWCGDKLVQVEAWTAYGKSGEYLVIPADGRDDRPWQMKV